jgi:hypothetical protein
MNEDIIVIADTQVAPGVPVEHLLALSKYIWEHKPKYIVHIGDHWDMESLSSYASPMEKEGKRLIDDILAGMQGLEMISSYWEERNRLAKRVPYKPELHFLMGNHEYRLDKFINNTPALEGIVDIRKIIQDFGWTISEFCVPKWINGIAFNHYMENPMSGRPVGGSIENKLNKFPHSFVHGHQQQYQFGRRQNLQGKPHFGVCAGAFYMHDEGYRGANNTEQRGFTHLKGYINRYDYQDYDVDFVSVERLLEMYK